MKFLTFFERHGNGSGYPGKAQLFAKRDLDGSCATSSIGQEAIESEIELEGSRAFLIRENCMDLAPKELSPHTFANMAHNETYLTTDKELFEEVKDVESKEVTKFLCRGSGLDGSLLPLYADINIYQDLESGSFSMEYVLAGYNMFGQVVEKHRLEKLAAQYSEDDSHYMFSATLPSSLSGFMKIFNIFGFLTKNSFNLEIDKNSQTGRITNENIIIFFDNFEISEMDCFIQQ